MLLINYNIYVKWMWLMLQKQLNWWGVNMFSTLSDYMIIKTCIEVLYCTFNFQYYLLVRIFMNGTVMKYVDSDSHLIFNVPRDFNSKMCVAWMNLLLWNGVLKVITHKVNEYWVNCTGTMRVGCGTTAPLQTIVTFVNWQNISDVSCQRLQRKCVGKEFVSSETLDCPGRSTSKFSPKLGIYLMYATKSSPKTKKLFVRYSYIRI